MEGVSFGLRDGWDSLGRAPGTVASLSLVGGGARSPLWAQWLASTLGVTLHTHEGGEAGGALGAARLAWLATGASLAEVCQVPRVSAAYTPDADEAALMAPRLQRWRSCTGPSPSCTRRCSRSSRYPPTRREPGAGARCRPAAPGPAGHARRRRKPTGGTA